MRWGGRGVISRQYSVLRIGGDWGNAIPDRVLTEIKPRVDAAVVPRSLRSANRHAETACKKKPVRSGRDDKTGLKVKGVARSLHSATAEGAVAPVGMTIWRSTKTMGPTRRKAARERRSRRAGPFGSAQGRRNDRLGGPSKGRAEFKVEGVPRSLHYAARRATKRRERKIGPLRSE